MDYTFNDKNNNGVATTSSLTLTSPGDSDIIDLGFGSFMSIEVREDLVLSYKQSKLKVVGEWLFESQVEITTVSLS